MTLYDVATQLYSLSVAGYFNGEKFTRRQLEHYIRNAFRCEETLHIPHRLFMEIALPDGRWLFYIYHYNTAADGYDYTIPVTREQEHTLADLLVA